MAANPFAALDMSDDDDDTGTAVKQVAKAKEEPKAKAPKAKTDAKPAAARSEWWRIDEKHAVRAQNSGPRGGALRCGVRGSGGGCEWGAANTTNVERLCESNAYASWPPQHFDGSVWSCVIEVLFGTRRQ
jgi:hypothetical protein